MAHSLNLRNANIMVTPAHWAQFKTLAHSQGLNLSAALRQLIAKELRRVEKESTK
jgi:post-segregation antitoxin (ccd killing protein)